MSAETEDTLTLAEAQAAMARIAAWRADTAARVACPRCDRPGAIIVDRSARPYAEWYAISCAACGLATTLHIPMSPPAVGGAD